MKTVLINEIKLSAKPLRAFGKTTFARIFTYSLCISFAACAPGFQVRKQTGVIVEGQIGVSSAAEVQSVTVSSFDVTSAKPRLVNVTIRDGERVVAIDVPVTFDNERVIAGVGHEVDDGRDYRIQATCSRVMCDDVAVVFFIAQAGGSTMTKSYYFDSAKGALLLAQGPVGGLPDADTTLAQLKRQQSVEYTGRGDS